MAAMTAALSRSPSTAENQARQQQDQHQGAGEEAGERGEAGRTPRSPGLVGAGRGEQAARLRAGQALGYPGFGLGNSIRRRLQL